MIAPGTDATINRNSKRRLDPVAVDERHGHFEPFAPIEDYQRQQRSKVKDDIEGKTRVLPPFEEPRDQYQVGRAGDWQKLGQTLNDAENDSLKYRKHNNFSYLSADRAFRTRLCRVGHMPTKLTDK